LKDDILYLVHIKECIERVKRYTEGGHDSKQAFSIFQVLH
jgi:hypothetical protein